MIYRELVGIFDIAGQFISGQLTKPSYDNQEKLASEYFEELKIMARKEEQKTENERKQIGYQPDEEPEPEPPVTDMTPEKIKKGTACILCSSDHFSTASGMLNESLRFKKEGMGSWEIQRRIGIALDELNSMERGDLHADQIAGLNGKEKQLANEAKEDSRNLRHKINAIHSFEDLENVAAEAANIRTKFMKNMWDVATLDGSAKKLCKGLEAEEKERCISVINTVLEKREIPLETADEIGS